MPDKLSRYSRKRCGPNSAAFRSACNKGAVKGAVKALKHWWLRDGEVRTWSVWTDDEPNWPDFEAALALKLVTKEIETRSPDTIMGRWRSDITLSGIALLRIVAALERLRDA
jgi:hypothetical protein